MAHLLRGPEHTAGVTQLRVHTPGLLGPRPQLQVLVGLAGAATELGVAAVSVRPVQRQVLGTSTLWLRALRVVAELLRRERLESVILFLQRTLAGEHKTKIQWQYALTNTIV